MIDQLGGWALKSVGQGYGDGYDLKLLIKHLGRIECDWAVGETVKSTKSKRSSEERLLLK
jgi:hypothetical protein